MILVDTSVWVDHIRAPIPTLAAQLAQRNVLCHEMVLGELACGNLPNRVRRLQDLKALPQAATVSASDVLALIEGQRLMGSGIGYVDANLLGSVLSHHGATLWTADRRLRQIAEELGIAHIESGGA